MALRPFAARAWATANAGPFDTALIHPATAGRNPGHKPMNDDVTIVPAAVRASVKIDSQFLD
jgi:hypothetical protein